MVLHHTGSLAEISADLEPNVAFSTAMVPAGPVMRVQGVAPQYNGMCKEDNGDTSWAWLTEWATPDAAVALLEATGYFPGVVDRRAGSTHHGKPDLCPGNRGDSDRCAAPQLRWRPRLGRHLGAAGLPAGTDRPGHPRKKAVDQMIADLEAEIG